MWHKTEQSSLLFSFCYWDNKYWNTFIVIENNINSRKHYKEQGIRHDPCSRQLENCPFMFCIYSNILTIRNKLYAIKKQTFTCLQIEEKRFDELILNNGYTAGLVKEQAIGTLPLASMDFHPVQGECSEATPPPSSAFMSLAAERMVTCSYSLLYSPWF